MNPSGYGEICVQRTKLGLIINHRNCRFGELHQFVLYNPTPIHLEENLSNVACD